MLKKIWVKLDCNKPADAFAKWLMGGLPRFFGPRVCNRKRTRLWQGPLGILNAAILLDAGNEIYSKLSWSSSMRLGCHWSIRRAYAWQIRQEPQQRTAAVLNLVSCPVSNTSSSAKTWCDKCGTHGSSEEWPWVDLMSDEAVSSWRDALGFRMCWWI